MSKSEAPAGEVSQTNALSRLVQRLVKGKSPAEIHEIVAESATLAKGMGEAQDLKPSEFVEDRWQEGEKDKVPSAAEVKTGPSTAATGSEAGPFSRMHDDLATQTAGNQRDHEKIGRLVKSLLAPVIAEVALLKGAVETLAKSQADAAAVLAKADEAAEEETDKSKAMDDDAKACSALLERAGAAFESAKGKLQRSEAVGVTRPTLAKSLFDEAAADIGKALTLAKAASEIASTAEVGAFVKSVQDFAKANEVDHNQEVWPDSGAGKSKVVAKSEDGDKDDAPMDKSVPATDPNLAKAMETLQNAVAGIGMLKGKVDEVMAVISSGGKPQANGAPAILALAKSQPLEFAKSMQVAAAKAHEDGELSFEDMQVVGEICMKHTAGVAGQLHEDAWKDRLAKSSMNVRAFFKSHEIA